MGQIDESQLRQLYKDYIKNEERKVAQSTPVTIITSIIFFGGGFLFVNLFGWLYGIITTIVILIIVGLILHITVTIPYKALKSLSYEDWAREYLTRQDLIRKNNYK